MEDKKQDVNSLEELFKVVNAYSGWFANLADELSKVLADIKAPKKEEDTWEMKCPYKIGDEYWCLYSYGGIYTSFWSGTWEDKDRFNSGNIFPNKETAELEAKRRELLTRFRTFRDECNGDWKADWNDINQEKYLIRCEETDLHVVAYWTLNGFNLFGCFKDDKDAQRAIKLFGDELKELFVEGDA